MEDELRKIAPKIGKRAEDIDMETQDYLAVIRDEDFGVQARVNQNPRYRKTTRAVVFDAAGKIATLHIAKRNVWDFPGG